MPRDFKRADRVADAVQRSLAQIIQHEIRDPRVGLVNINRVDVTKDITLARVYVTFVDAIDDDEEGKQGEASVAILNKAASYLRNLLAKDLNIRTTPRIQFFFDRNAVHGQTLSSLIDKVVADDKAKKAESGGEEE